MSKGIYAVYLINCVISIGLMFSLFACDDFNDSFNNTCVRSIVWAIICLWIANTFMILVYSIMRYFQNRANQANEEQTPGYNPIEI